jgi:hypothetical protein
MLKVQWFYRLPDMKNIVQPSLPVFTNSRHYHPFPADRELWETFHLDLNPAAVVKNKAHVVFSSEVKNDTFFKPPSQFFMR